MIAHVCMVEVNIQTIVLIAVVIIVKTKIANKIIPYTIGKQNIDIFSIMLSNAKNHKASNAKLLIKLLFETY